MSFDEYVSNFFGEGRRADLAAAGRFFCRRAPDPLRRRNLAPIAPCDFIIVCLSFERVAK
jgi:hypothetical protein